MSDRPQSLRHRTLSGIIWMGFAAGGRALIQLLILSILARLLTPREFGVVGAALVVVAFSQLFSRLGVGQSLVQIEAIERRHRETGFIVSVVFSLAIAGGVWILAPVAADFYGIREVKAVLRPLALLFPLRGIATVAEAALRRDLRFKRLAAIDTVALALGYGVVGVVAAINDLGVWALVLAQLSQSTLRAIVLLATYPPVRIPRMSRSALRELLQLGGGFTAGSIATYVAQHVDNVLVGRWLGPTALGLYGRAYQMMAMPANLFGSVLTIVLFPAMARVQDSKKALASAYTKGVAAIALMTGPTSVVVAVLGVEIVALVLGPQWHNAVSPLRLLALGTLFRTSFKMSESISKATGAVYRRAWRQWTYVAIVALAVWTGQQWDITGVAGMILIALAINFLLMAQLSLKLAEMTWRDFRRAHAPALRLAALAGAVSAGIRALLVLTDLSSTWVLVGTSAAVVVSVSLVTWRLPTVFLGAEGLWVLRRFKEFVIRSNRQVAHDLPNAAWEGE
jgi:PST family polysaccharide transporter